MLLLLCGKPTGKPKYNYPFCHGTAPFEEPGTLYTIGDLYLWHQKFLESGARSKDQQHFQNLVNSPLITGPEDLPVLSLLNCPSLHILIGVVNKLIKEMENNVFSSQTEGKTWMESFLKRMHIARKKKQGNNDLEGNQSRDFLRCIDKLEVLLMRECPDRIVEAMPYIVVLKAFDKVVHSCFGVTLVEGYKENITMFSKLYRELGITVTPKVQHITDFMALKGEAAGLGFYSEQAMESVHQDFKVILRAVHISMDTRMLHET